MRSARGHDDHVKDLLEAAPDSLSTPELADRILELQIYRARLDLARARALAEIEARALQAETRSSAS